MDMGRVLGGTTGFVVESALDLVLQVLGRLNNIVTGGCSLVLCIVAMAVFHMLRSVLRVAPCLLGRALDLLRRAFVRQFLVANCLTDLLLHATGNLFNFAADLILVHCNTPLLHFGSYV